MPRVGVDGLGAFVRPDRKRHRDREYSISLPAYWIRMGRRSVFFVHCWFPTFKV